MDYMQKVLSNEQSISMCVSGNRELSICESFFFIFIFFNNYSIYSIGNTD